MTKFHFAFKVKDIESTYKFYHNILKCKVGRQTKDWIDFDFYGHQLSAHITRKIDPLDYCGHVDNIEVPIPHFGCILSSKQFEDAKSNLIAYNVEFIVKPQVRYKGSIGETTNYVCSRFQ